MSKARDLANLGSSTSSLATDAEVTARLWAAGKNKILNGDFGIWQRGTSIACSTGAVFTADRFSTNRDGSGATVTVSRQAFTPGGAPVAGYEGAYFIRFDQSVAGSGASFSVLQTAIEDVRTLAGQTVTFSFWAKASANYNANVTARQYFGVGGSAPVDTYFGTFNVTTSWTRFTTSVTLPSVSGKTIGTGSALLLWIDLPLNAIRTVDTWGWQLEAGSVATPFTTATGNPASELQACQRRYCVLKFSGGKGGPIFTTYVPNGDTRGWIFWPVEMAYAPSVSFNTSSWVVIGSGDLSGVVNATVNVTAAGASVNGTSINVSNPSALSGASASVVSWGSNSSFEVYASAEL